ALGTIAFTRKQPTIGWVTYQLRSDSRQVQIQQANRLRAELVAKVDVVLHALGGIFDDDTLILTRADSADLQFKMYTAGIMDAGRSIEDELGGECRLGTHGVASPRWPLQ